MTVYMYINIYSFICIDITRTQQIIIIAKRL